MQRTRHERRHWWILVSCHGPIPIPIPIGRHGGYDRCNASCTTGGSMNPGRLFDDVFNLVHHPDFLTIGRSTRVGLARTSREILLETG